MDQALQKLQNHLDDSYLLGVPQIMVLHGKGDGVLRPAIQNFLRETPHVSRFRSEHPDRGGRWYNHCRLQEVISVLIKKFKLVFLLHMTCELVHHGIFPHGRL